jgi:hypothetical protein
MKTPEFRSNNYPFAGELPEILGKYLSMADVSMIVANAMDVETIKGLGAMVLDYKDKIREAPEEYKDEIRRELATIIKATADRYR